MVWGSACLLFYVLTFFLKYLEGNMYLNGFLLGCADMTATCFFRTMIAYSSSKKALQVAYMSVLFFGLTFLVSQNQTLYLISLFGIRFGASTAFSGAYYSNTEYF
jgi:hypothetical protein